MLEAEPGNVKALYRRAQGHLAEQDLVEAELDIRAALLVSHPTSITAYNDCHFRVAVFMSDMRSHVQATMASAALAYRIMKW